MSSNWDNFCTNVAVVGNIALFLAWLIGLLALSIGGKQ
jgi:hypothetical protein